MADKPATCVIICYWVGDPLKNLFKLLDQMLRVEAGAIFSVVVVVNGGDKKPLSLSSKYNILNATIINRINNGYNIEAWDTGWRAHPHYDYYLFLQSDCFLKKSNWIADFEFRMAHDRGIGLMGEMYFWEQKTWQFIRESTDRDLGDTCWPQNEPLHPIDAIKTAIQEHGLPLTELGTHISAIIHFTSRKILEEIGGYPLFGSTYRLASASEVAFSRLIESKGYRLSKIRDRDFSIIGHRQYTRGHEIKMKIRKQVINTLKFLRLKS